MRTLKEALVKVNTGWSAKGDISDRAFAMKSHLHSGNVERAEELASEVLALQDAYNTANPPFYVSDKTGKEEWHLSLDLWSAILRSGAWQVSRSIFMDLGSSDEQAASYVRMRFGRHATPQDVIPLYPATRMAAE